MHENISLRTRANRVLRRVGALTAIGVAASTLAAGAAQAQPINGSGTSRGCPVEDEHGNVTYVPVGTRVGLFHCGSDGEWHFGWLTTDLVGPSSGSQHHLGAAVPVTATRSASR
jgi:hypothetical protein